ncbi:hypothetical protein [Azospirillum sp. B4]|uniref:hypothetical protein n=1 Tax=Azospirillum sp. B4 TaxID=95605 RepID=UPI0003458A33|nr:hypothetical protein [Azospirillum sp. B4]
MPNPIPLSVIKSSRTDKFSGPGGERGPGEERGEERGGDPWRGIPLMEEERLRRYARSLGDRAWSEILMLYAECLADAGVGLDLALQLGAVGGVRHYGYLLTGTAAEMGPPGLAHITRFLARRAVQGVAEADALPSLRQVLASTQAAVGALLDQHLAAVRGPQAASA